MGDARRAEKETKNFSSPYITGNIPVSVKPEAAFILFVQLPHEENKFGQNCPLDSSLRLVFAVAQTNS